MGPFVYRIERRPGYIYLWQRGCPDIEDLITMQADLEHEMALAQVWRLLSDNREMIPPSEECRNFMITWFDTPGRFEAIALVINSAMIAVRTNMDALAKRVIRRGFGTPAEAEAWLLAKG